MEQLGRTDAAMTDRYLAVYEKLLSSFRSPRLQPPSEALKDEAAAPPRSASDVTGISA